MNTILERVCLAEEYIRTKTKEQFVLGMILGSGLGGGANFLDDKIHIPFQEIPGFPQPSVEGHTGELVIGRYNGIPVVTLSGRVHYYEGIPQNEITIPVRVLRRLGVTTLILTNAAGGINPEFSTGALMLISDHINYSGYNPLIGENDDAFGVRFPDMSNVYDRTLRKKVCEVAKKTGIPLKEGVYMMFSGPSFETPAEIRFARTVGASAVGMSTVPEAIAAAHCGLKTIGISLITNMAAGMLDQPLTHEEVQATAAVASARFTKLVDGNVTDVM